MTTLREQVQAVLDDVLEGRGIGERDDDDIDVWLGGTQLWIRVQESPPVVSVYRAVTEVSSGWGFHERFLELNRQYVVFRVFVEQETVFMRADIPAQPLARAYLQLVLDGFGTEVEKLSEELHEWN